MKTPDFSVETTPQTPKVRYFDQLGKLEKYSIFFDFAPFLPRFHPPASKIGKPEYAWASWAPNFIAKKGKKNDFSLETTPQTRKF